MKFNERYFHRILSKTGNTLGRMSTLFNFSTEIDVPMP